MRRSLRSSAALLTATLFFTLLGCKKEGKPDGAEGGTPTRVVTLTWNESYSLSAQGVSGSATFFVTRDTDKPPLKLQATFHEFPPGTKIKLGSEQGTISDSGFFSALVDIKPAVVKQSLSDLKGAIELGLDLAVEVPGAHPATTKLRPQNVKDGVRLALLKARDGGMTLGPDDQAALKPRGAAVISGYSDLEFVGNARTLLEVDWVAIAEDQKEARATKTCKFREGPTILKVFDARAVIVERRTGKLVAEHTLKASDECPMFALVNKDENTTKKSVAPKDVEDWARAELAKANQ